MSSRPLVSLLGTNRSIWVNFYEICEEKQVLPERMLKHVEASLKTKCHSDEDQLMIMGRFTSENIRSVLASL